MNPENWPEKWHEWTMSAAFIAFLFLGLDAAAHWSPWVSKIAGVVAIVGALPHLGALIFNREEGVYAYVFPVAVPIVSFFVLRYQHASGYVSW